LYRVREAETRAFIRLGARGLFCPLRKGTFLDFLFDCDGRRHVVSPRLWQVVDVASEVREVRQWGRCRSGGVCPKEAR
jgi:hypothetical protein